MQDYRNRHSYYVGFDEGLRNLRRRAPVMASWGDRELAAGAWGNKEEGFGADGHQTTCSKRQKETNLCDRDEGDVKARFKAAIQAYLEWMPVRYVPEGGPEGLDIGTITQVIEWGNLATIATFDTRLANRSEKHAGGSRVRAFGGFAVVNGDYKEYRDESSEVNGKLKEFSKVFFDNRDDPDISLAGDSVKILEQSFSASKAAGKPWQIWGCDSMLTPFVLPDPNMFHLGFPKDVQSSVQSYFDDAYNNKTVKVQLRAISAISAAGIEWNTDDYGGYGAERTKILKMAKDNGWNMIAVGGDINDASAWQLYEGGARDGTPVAVNLGAPGTSTPGMAEVLFQYISGLKDVVGGEDTLYDGVNAAFKSENEGLKFTDLQHFGFIAVEATKETHTATFFGIPEDTIMMNYEEARKNSERASADISCLATVQTKADSPGSLEVLSKDDSCLTTDFASSRSAIFSIAVPKADLPADVQAATGCGFEGCDVTGSSEGNGNTGGGYRPVWMQGRVGEIVDMINSFFQQEKTGRQWGSKENPRRRSLFGFFSMKG